MAREWWAFVLVWGIFLGGSNEKNWGDHQKKNFFINSVKLSMCDGPIEVFKYVWVNTLYILDWIFSQNCRNPFPLHAPGQLVRSKEY